MTALVFVGNFPPPVHGMAAINQAFYDAVQGVQPRPPIRINISPPSLSRNFSNRARKVLRVLEGLPRFVGAAWGKQATLYMSISGGSGQLYELLFTLYTTIATPIWIAPALLPVCFAGRLANRPRILCFPQEWPIVCKTVTV